MKCPHCAIGVSLEWDHEECTYPAPNYAKTKRGQRVAHTACPECDRLIVVLESGPCEATPQEHYTIYDLVSVEGSEVLFPKASLRPVPSEVPADLAVEFQEACGVLPTSPKASAALSRRILQRILREHFKITHATLDKEIQAFLAIPHLPSYLSSAVDAVRNVGNFAAHPIKDTNTGEIADVEPGEAEWLIEVLESLFDFAYVQPKRLNDRKQALNAKLKALGKPPMKA